MCRGHRLRLQNARPVIARLHPEERYTAAFIGRLVDHITEFSLGGIERIAKAVPPSKRKRKS